MSDEIPQLPKGSELKLKIDETRPVNDRVDPPFLTLAQMEKLHIIEALKLHKGNKTRAAVSLGVTIKTLYNKLHEYELFDQYKIHGQIVCPVVEEAKRRGSVG